MGMVDKAFRHKTDKKSHRISRSAIMGKISFQTPGKAIFKQENCIDHPVKGLNSFQSETTDRENGRNNRLSSQ